VTLEESGARDLQEAVLTVAGTSQRGQHPTTFADGRMTVRSTSAPPCTSLPDDVPPACSTCACTTPPATCGRSPSTSRRRRLERLLRYRCS
jgi:hypothetical protein